MYYAYDLWQVYSVFMTATSSSQLPKSSSAVYDIYPVTPITVKSFQLSLSGIFKYQVYQFISLSGISLLGISLSGIFTIT